MACHWHAIFFGVSMMKMLFCVILLGAVAALGSAAQAADALAGKTRAGTCAGCHGVAGISSNSMWPNLAGQQPGYLVKQLKAFRDGSRTDPMMSVMAKPLTDEDIANLAAWYSGLQPSVEE
jgi:cytochrome c553